MKLTLRSIILLLFGLPILLLFIQAGAPGWRYPDLLPSFSFEGSTYLLQQSPSIFRSLLSSVVISMGTVLLSVLICIFPAQVFGLQNFRGKQILEGLLLMPALVPSMTFSMGLHIVFIRMGLADTTPGVILVLTVISYPYMLRSLSTGYALMGKEFRICSRNLGASAWRTFWSVELPLLFPAMAAGGSVIFLVAFSEYFLVFLIGGGNVMSFTGYLFPVITSSNRGLGAMVTLIFLIVPIVLFALLECCTRSYYRRRGMR